MPGEEVYLIVPASPFSLRVQRNGNDDIWLDRGRPYAFGEPTAERFCQAPVPTKFECYDGTADGPAVLRNTLETGQTGT